jgi:hypothetical protein
MGLMMLKIQLSESTDNITADGTELTRLPYPFYVDQDGVIINRWAGQEEVAVIGFVRNPNRQEVDVWWADVIANRMWPTLTGLYMISRERGSGIWSTHLQAVKSVTEVTS